MTQAPEWWEGASKQLVKEQETSLEKHLAPLKKDVNQLKGDVKVLQSGQHDLASRVSALEAGGPTVSQEWAPAFVEIFGFCKFDEKDEKGITRPESQALVQTLKALLDPSLQPHVRDFQLRASKNHIVKVPITPIFLNEIKNTWGDYLSNE